MNSPRCTSSPRRRAWSPTSDASRARAGLAVNGALDQFAARAANALVGNAPTDPLIEATGFGLTLRPSHDVLMSVTGAPAEPAVDGRAYPAWAPLSVRAGETVRVGIADVGLRAYVAVHGSFEVPG
ncbi:hypothetical protein NKH77_08095 [Streptomyces sp. M19]